MKILLSVIIPVYNVENYLHDCIESVLKSNREDYELLLINDGSKDKSKDICEEYARKKSFIRCISQENRGLSGARNTGIRNAKGEYVLFLDSDDYLADGAIDEICNKIEENSVDCFMIRSKSFEDGSTIYKENQCSYEELGNIKNPIDVFKKLDSIGEFWFAAWLLVVNRNFLVKNNLFFFERIYHEDELWVPQIFVVAKSIKLINSCLYCYRLNRVGSIIYKKNIKKELDKIIVMDELCKIVNTVSGKVQLVIRRRIAALEWGLIRNYYVFKDEEQSKMLYESIKNRKENLKCGKYRIIYFLCRLLGIKRVSYVVGKLGKI